MLQQVELHSREFPDIRRLQTLVTSDASMKSSKISKQMRGTAVHTAFSFFFVSISIPILALVFA